MTPLDPIPPEAARTPRQRNAIGQALTLGTNMAVGMAVFTLAGLWVDRRRGGGVLWTLCGMFVGVAYGAYEAWKTIVALNGADEEERARKRGPPPQG